MKATGAFLTSHRPISLKKKLCLAATAMAVIGCLGVVLADTVLPTTDLSSWINQQMQSGQTSSQTSVSSGIQLNGSSMSSTSQTTTTLGTGTSCTSCASTGTACEQPTTPVVTSVCDPFSDLYGKDITVVLDGQVTVWGKFLAQCSGFLILQHTEDGRTTFLRVSIQKILYVQSD
jgi:hypothetical protein